MIGHALDSFQIVEELDVMLEGRGLYSEWERMLLIDQIQRVALVILLFELEELNQLLVVEVLHNVVCAIFQGCFGQAVLEDLPFVDVLLDWPTGDESVNYDISFLPNTIDPINALVVIGWVPVWIDNDGSVCRHKVETYPWDLVGQEETEYILILVKVLTDSISLIDRHTPIKPSVLVVGLLLNDSLDQIQKDLGLREDQDLVTGGL